MRRAVLVCLAGALALAGCSPSTTPEPVFTRVPTVPPPTATTPATATTAATAAPPTASPEPSATPVVAAGAPTVAPEGPAIIQLAAGQALTITAIDMLSGAAGWAAGETAGDLDDRLLTTADGGQTWHDVTPPQPIDAALALGQGATFAALDSQTAWATFYDRTGGPLSNVPFIWRTVDGGQTWSASRPLDVTDAELFSPSDLVFVDGQSGWLLVHVGAGMMHDYVMLFTTHDGGLTWDRLVDPFTEPDNGLAQSCGKTGLVFTEAQTGWITGDCGGVQPGAPYLYKSTDAGRTWAFLELPPPADRADLYQVETMACGVQAPLFAKGPALVLAITCQDYNTNQSLAYLYRTADSGASWATEPLTGGFSAGVFLNPEAGWVLGPAAANAAENVLAQTVDGGASLVDLKQLNWAGPLDFVDTLTGWAIARTGEEQALVRTTDGGKTWQLITPQIAP
ncbi:MAG: hypothetical protein JNK29_18465 [Anaerolineales bacterium]|nr:hypothetical protein [Anaerolineales bacterium]